MDTMPPPLAIAEESPGRDANHVVTLAALQVIRAHIERHMGGDDRVVEATRAFERARDALGRPWSLAVLQRICQLTDFERDIVLLSSCDQLDAELARLLPSSPTFGLALAALPGAHWSAFTPIRPLRAFPLLLPIGHDLLHEPLRLDERILHFISGIPYLDERLHGLCHPVLVPNAPSPTVRTLAQRLREAWLAGSVPALVVGDDPTVVRMAIATACATVNRQTHRLDARDIPVQSNDRIAWARLWSREAQLLDSALVIELPDDAGPETTRCALDLVQRVGRSTAITSSQPVGGADAQLLQRLEAQPRSLQECCDQLLGHFDDEATAALEPLASAALSHFRLSHDALRIVAERTRAAIAVGAEPGETLWVECRRQVRSRLGALAHCIEPKAAWDDLVLPPPQLSMLRSLVAQVRQRDVVHRKWRFRDAGGRGFGITALFWGTSGTGKSLAAEVVAQELRVDLYHVDLSAVVSKYIGETEKNLSKIFDAAEAGGAVLLFDEADSLFGRRSEVRDSHDRYANIEVSYLLQRMESYRGLAILTTNLKSVMDSAFLRRLRMVVGFPFPDAQQREHIWQRLVPPGAPVEELCFSRLAKLSLSGGEIRNIVLTAAFAAAEEDVPLRMRHFAEAARIELAKSDQALRASEVSGWT